MRKYFFIAFSILLIIGIGFAAYRLRPEPAHLFHIAIVTRKGVGNYEEAIKGYRARMQVLGYVEGKTVTYDIRYFIGTGDLPQTVTAVLATHPDVICTFSTPATVEAYKQTNALPVPTPIVFNSMADPVVAGVVKSFAAPGTNVTGVANLSADLTAKRLQLLKEINPEIKRVAFPHSDASLGDAAANKSVAVGTDAARTLGITLELLPVKSEADNAAVAASITAKDADGIVIGGDSLVWSGLKAYADQAIKEKIPLAVFDTSQVEAGGLVGLGPDYTILGAQAAGITNQILRGTAPGNISIQVPEKFILAINMATARAIGISIPSDMLKQADLLIGN